MLVLQDRQLTSVPSGCSCPKHLWKISPEYSGRQPCGRRHIPQTDIIAQRTVEFYKESMQDIFDDLKTVTEYMPSVKKKNPTLLSEINDILEWE